MNKKGLFVILAATALAAGCKHKPAASIPGAKVTFNYTLTVDGQVVDSSAGKAPMAVTMGAGQIVPGVEETLAAMRTGEKRSVIIPPEKGYGPYRAEGVRQVPKKSFKNIAGLKPGMMVNGQSGGRPFMARVKEIGAKEITLDFNHPLAGKTLNFDLELVTAQAPGA